MFARLSRFQTRNVAILSKFDDLIRDLAEMRPTIRSMLGPFVKTTK